jgi:hypothetical protein
MPYVLLDVSMRMFCFSPRFSFSRIVHALINMVKMIGKSVYPHRAAWKVSLTTVGIQPATVETHKTFLPHSSTCINALPTSQKWRSDVRLRPYYVTSWAQNRKLKGLRFWLTGFDRKFDKKSKTRRCFLLWLIQLRKHPISICCGGEICKRKWLLKNLGC